MRRRGPEGADLAFVGTVEMGQYLRGLVLLLRLDLALLSSVIALKKTSIVQFGVTQNKDKADFIVSFDQNRRDCELVAKQAEETTRPREQAEGHLLVARYIALEISAAPYSRGRKPPSDDGQRLPCITDLREKGLLHLESALRICTERKGST